MKRVFLTIAMLIFPTLVSAQDLVAPAINPEAVNSIIQVIIAVTAAFPWGIWVAMGFTALGVIVGIVRVLVQMTPGDADDNWVTKYLGWVPTAVSAKTANKIVGKGALNLDAAGAVAKLHSAQYESLKPKKQGLLSKIRGRKLGLIFIGLLCMGALPMCSAVTGNGDKADRLDQIRGYLEITQSGIAATRAELPALYTVLDTICDFPDSPEFCEDVAREKIKDDMDSALAAADAAISVALEAVQLGKVKSAEEAVQKVVQAMVRITVVYVQITAIVARHQ